MADTLNQPVILISGGSAGSASVQAAAAMIRGAGGVPLILSNHLGRVKGMNREQLYAEIGDVLKKCDGVMVMGNNGDIDPGEYGAQNNGKTHSELFASDGKTVSEDGMARRNYEVALLKSAMAARMPVLGVCGGMQRINVLMGGSLHQHVPDLVGHDEHAQQEHHIAPFVPVQPVLLEPGSMLGAMAGEIQTVYTPAHGENNPAMVMENSMHHQAIANVGKGLRVSAAATDKLPDGRRLIEGIEADQNGPLAGQFLLGVQWHPEFGASPLGARIAAHFTSAVQAYAQAQGRTHSMQEILSENVLSAVPTVTLAAHDMRIRQNSMTELVLRERARVSTYLGQPKH